jgi:hypothetical protein
MKLHASRIPVIAAQMVKALTADQAVECVDDHEAQLDVQSVLSEYVRAEQDISERAKDMVARRNLPPTELGKIKRMLADQQQLKLGEESVDYLLDQLLEMLMYSNNIEEIYVEDVELRRRLREPLRREAEVEEQLQQEIRGRLRHVQEGSSLWEVEYRRMMEDIKRRRGL